MNLGEFLEGVIGGLVATEAFGWTGRLAQKIIPAAVRLWTTDTARREIYREAWSRDVDDCPGNIWRLILAAKFLSAGLGRWAARQAVSATRRAQRRSPARMGTSEILSMFVKRPSVPKNFPAFMNKVYGVKVRPAGRLTHGEEAYQTKDGDLVTASQQGACGTSYWQVFRYPRQLGQEPIELIRLGTSNETGQFHSLLCNPWGQTSLAQRDE